MVICTYTNLIVHIEERAAHFSYVHVRGEQRKARSLTSRVTMRLP